MIQAVVYREAESVMRKEKISACEENYAQRRKF